jgi:hypothetical protein
MPVDEDGNVISYEAMAERLDDNARRLGIDKDSKYVESRFRLRVMQKAKKDNISEDEAERLLKAETAARLAGEYSPSKLAEDRANAAPPGKRPQIESKQEAIVFFNKNHFAAYLNGKYKVIRENPNGSIEIMDKKDFIDGHQGFRILITDKEGGKPQITPATELWLKSDDRRHFRYGLDFDPSAPGNRNEKYNLFKGYKLVKGEAGDCTIFFNFMREVICSGNESDYNYLVALIAQMFQEPDKKPGIAVVIRSEEEGTGKSWFVERLCDLMSPYYFKTSNPSYVFDDHNGQLKHVILLHLEEAVWAGSKKDESLLKDIITGRTIEINDKFVPVHSVPNHLHLFITGNPDWLVSAGFTARRLFALHSSGARLRDSKYFSDMEEWFHKGGDAALLHHFLTFDYKAALTKMGIDSLRLAPVTDELVHQKKQGMSSIAKWLDNLIELHEVPYGEFFEGEAYTHEGMEGTLLTKHVRVIKKALYYYYVKSQEQSRAKVIINENKFGSEFLKLLPLVIKGVVQKHKNGKIISVIDPDVKATDDAKMQRDAYDILPWPVVRRAFDFTLGKRGQYDIEDGEWTIVNLFYPEMRDWRRK